MGLKGRLKVINEQSLGDALYKTNDKILMDPLKTFFVCGKFHKRWGSDKKKSQGFYNS